MAVQFPEMLSTKEVAQIVHRHPRTIARWVRAGKLPGTYDEQTGLTLVYAEQLRDRLLAGEVANRPAPAKVTVARSARAQGPRDLTDAEWRARFAA